jgi:ribonuclease BN (tRNA processing enzyme)
MPVAATILGSGGFVPTGTRETSSLLLLPEGGDAAVVVDAGTGIRRLITDRGLLQGRRRLEVLLTHFHIDHVCGLAYLTELGDVDIHVHGPGAALYDTPTIDVLARLFSVPIMPIGLEDIGVGVGELGVGEAEMGGLQVRTRWCGAPTPPRTRGPSTSPGARASSPMTRGARPPRRGMRSPRPRRVSRGRPACRSSCSSTCRRWPTRRTCTPAPPPSTTA